MMSVCGVYRITNKETGKHYIGSSANISKRWKNHRSDLNNEKHCNPKLQHSWTKYGVDAFEFVVLLVCLPESVLMYEQALMDYYDAVNSGYNLLPVAGTRLGVKMPPEWCAKASELLKGRTFTEEHRRNLSIAKMGHPVSDAQKAKHSATITGRKIPQATIQKRSESIRGRRHSEAAIAKMRASQKAIGEQISARMKRIWAERKQQRELADVSN